MRFALIATSLAAGVMSLGACGGETEKAGPERRSAAGEVLGGEVTDDMLPLDTARSTAPSDPRAGAEKKPADDATRTRAPKAPLPVMPEVEASGGPEPYVAASEDPPA